MNKSLSFALRSISRSSPCQRAPIARFLSVSTRTLSKATPLEANNGKLDTIVELIASLTLLETSELVALLKTRLNISEIAMPAASSAAPVGGAATEAVTEEEKPVEKTEFTVKLEKFDAAAKAKIIREIKGLIPGANLVEAKKFVESVPGVIRENVPKEEAEKIKKTLEGLGATVILE